MRIELIIAVAAAAALAACGGESEPKAKAKARPQAIPAGQWQSDVEVTNLRRSDEGQPRLNMPAGTRETGGACIGSGASARPPAELFVGSGFEACRWHNDFYMRSGRIMGSATCQRPGVGEVTASLNIDFTETSFQGSVDLLTRLAGDGDVTIAARASGRRTGDCAAGGEAGNQTQTR